MKKQDNRQAIPTGTKPGTHKRSVSAPDATQEPVDEALIDEIADRIRAWIRQDADPGGR